MMNKRYERNHFKAFSNSINKKKLYKKGKEWVVGSLTLLAMTGMGVAIDHTTHADTNAKPTTTSVGSTADIENKATALYNHVVAKNITSNNANQGQQNPKEIASGPKSSKVSSESSKKDLINQNHDSSVPSNKMRGFGAIAETSNLSPIDYSHQNENKNPSTQDTIYGPDTYDTNTASNQKVYQKINTPGFQQYLENDAQNHFNQIKAANNDTSFTEVFIDSDFPRLGNSDMPNGLGDSSNAIAVISDAYEGTGNSGMISKVINNYRNAYNRAHNLPLSDTNYIFSYAMTQEGPRRGDSFAWNIDKVYVQIPPRFTVNYTYNGKVISTPFDETFSHRNWYYSPTAYISDNGTPAHNDYSTNNYCDYYNINSDGTNRLRELADYSNEPSDIDYDKIFSEFNTYNANKIYYSDWKDIPSVPKSILNNLPDGYQYSFGVTRSDLNDYSSQIQGISDYENSYPDPNAPQYYKSFNVNIPLTLNSKNVTLKTNNVITFVDKKTGKQIGKWVSPSNGHANQFDSDLYKFYYNISSPSTYSKANIQIPQGYTLSDNDRNNFMNYIYPPSGYVNGRFNYGRNYTIPLRKVAGNTITYLYNGQKVGAWTSLNNGYTDSQNPDMINIYNTITSNKAPGMPSDFYIPSSDLSDFFNAVYPPNASSLIGADYGDNYTINVMARSHIHVYFENADNGNNLMSSSNQAPYYDFISDVYSPFNLSEQIPNYQSKFNDNGYHYVGMMHPASSFDGNPNEVHTIDLLYTPNTSTKDYAPVEDTVNYKISGTNSEISSASHNITMYSRDTMSSATSVSYSKWSTMSSLAMISYPSEIESNHSYYREVSANSALPNDDQINTSLDSNDSMGASYVNNVYYVPITNKLTVNYIDTATGNIVKSTDAGTMNSGSRWTVSSDYFNQVPNNYILDNSYDNGANNLLRNTPITVTANGNTTANIYVKLSHQSTGSIIAHYVTSDNRPIQINGQTVSNVTFTGQPLTNTTLEKPIPGYSSVSVMGKLNYTNCPKDVFVVYKPSQKVTRGHIHVRYVDDSNNGREMWSDKFSDNVGRSFNLSSDNYANRYIPNRIFDGRVENNVSDFSSWTDSAPHVIIVGYSIPKPTSPSSNPVTPSSTANVTPPSTSSSAMLSSSSVVPPVIPSIPSTPSQTSSSSASSRVPSRRNARAVTKDSASDVAPSYMKPAHQRVITKKNAKSLMNQLNKLIRKGHGLTHHQAKLYRKLTRKHNNVVTRRHARGTFVWIPIVKRNHSHYVRRTIGERRGHGLITRRQLKLRKATNAKVQRQRKNAKKLPQTSEAHSYSALYAMLFVISAVIMADLGRAIDRRRHE